jgi:toxin ParE1/3/4
MAPPGLRSFHLQYSRAKAHKAKSTKVRRPAHIVYNRAISPDLIEIVRVFHERMDPSRHLDDSSEDRD